MMIWGRIDFVRLNSFLCPEITMSDGIYKQGTIEWTESAFVILVIKPNMNSCRSFPSQKASLRPHDFVHGFDSHF